MQNIFYIMKVGLSRKLRYNYLFLRLLLRKPPPSSEGGRSAVYYCKFCLSAFRFSFIIGLCYLLPPVLIMPCILAVFVSLLFLLRLSHGCYQAVFACTYQVVAPCSAQCIVDNLFILRLEVLEQSSLLGFFPRSSGNIDFFHCIRVKTCVEHTGRNRTGCGIKVLYLLGVKSFFF